MKTDIREVLHFYLGCESYWAEDGMKSTYSRKIDYDMLKEADWIKPLLRPLSSMTEEEFNEMYFKMPGGVEIESRATVEPKRFDITPHQVKYLLSKGFDLFGLIDSSQALDISKQ